MGFMEKNLVVVYESIGGALFLLKPMGDQVLMLNPGTELTSLRVKSVNWNDLEKPRVYNGESTFNYLCMTGDQISTKMMFIVLIKNLSFGFYDDGAAKEISEILNSWGIGCPYEPINVNFRLYERVRNGDTELHYSCDGYDNYVCGEPNYLGEDLGISLNMLMETNFFPEINVEIEQGGFNDAAFEIFKQALVKEVGENSIINLSFKKD
jgi:hypothetical protein